MTKILDGKKIASQIIDEIKANVQALKGRKPGLAFLLVGDNPASQSYVRSKKKACTETGIVSTLIELPASTSEASLIEHIHRLNHNPNIDGILIQLPLPAHINEKAIMNALDPNKDVDGFHPINMGKLLLGDETGFVPCTPQGIHYLLQKSHISTEGKHVVIIGRSNIVGKPLAALLMQKKSGYNATVTICHSKSTHLASLTKTADILIAALGQPHFVHKNMVKEGAIVIDVGIHRKNGKIIGDVDTHDVVPIVSHISPVPGGVGPMTIAMLLKNTFLSYQRKHD
jgi:methylenetetrahydrofolate dehydrogenase (NADP+)/methenyltetrahydrofolate cyclohydrolase